jgi:lipoprotein-anchoring transpeptidase ErfK/SrfK
MKLRNYRLKSTVLITCIALTGCSMMDDSSLDHSTTTVNNTQAAAPAQPAYEFPSMREATGNKIVIVDPNNHAWGAYDASGFLVAQGAASTGRDYCPDLGTACKTPSGTFTVYRKQGAECKSTKFPIPEGGAPMPHCMFFNGGYALHGSDYVPNYNASHGCVRLHPEDAAWLSQNFVTIGTKVQVLPY